MIINRKEIKIDDIKEGESRTFNIEIKNEYDEDIHISSVTQSCTCTLASLSGPEYLKKGDTSTVNIRFTPDSTGIMDRWVYVKFDRLGVGEFTDTINIKAKVDAS